MSWNPKTSLIKIIGGFFYKQFFFPSVLMMPPFKEGAKLNNHKREFDLANAHICTCGIFTLSNNIYSSKNAKHTHTPHLKVYL